MQFKMSILFLILIMIPLSSALPLEKSALTYQKADINPVFNNKFGAEGMPELSWKQPAPALSNRAWTQQVALFSTRIGASSFFLLSTDITKEGGEVPDTVFIDLNRNESLDDNERFALNRLNPADFTLDDPAPLFCAEKIPLPLDSGNPVFINLFLQLPAEQGEAKEKMVRIGMDGWGWMAGRTTLGGETYRVILQDRENDGVFGDTFERKSYKCDLIAFIPVSRKNAVVSDYLMPLRETAIVGGQVCRCSIEGNGENLCLESMDVAIGSLSIQPAGMKVYLKHDNWGEKCVLSGGPCELPEGTWKVLRFYNNPKGRSGADSYYAAPSDMMVDITPGAEAKLTLATDLKASMKAKERKGKLTLTLKLLTDQGSMLKGYSSGRLNMKGIPFTLLDKNGKAIHEASFEFG